MVEIQDHETDLSPNARYVFSLIALMCYVSAQVSFGFLIIYLNNAPFKPSKCFIQCLFFHRSFNSGTDV